ncbi:hypothetical protein CLERM_646 [Coxiella-like endosymbiont]|nr:hypothetical protein CLERM_646 [Coxiella-like endosymbiont]
MNCIDDEIQTTLSPSSKGGLNIKSFTTLNRLQPLQNGENTFYERTFSIT